MVFQYINICQVPREMLKTSAYGLGFQLLPRDLANVNAWKTMFDPYIEDVHVCFCAQKYNFWQNYCNFDFEISDITVFTLNIRTD